MLYLTLQSSLDKITTVYNPIRGGMGQIPYPGVPNVLAVRDNMILQIEKTSGKNARRYTSCDLNKILIGKVPDRGGRAWELEPPPEMPAFKQRQPDRGGGPQRGGHRGGGYGDRGRGHSDGGGAGGYSCGGYPNETRSDIGREGGGIGVGRGSYTQIHSQPMPPCTGGGGYMTDPYQMASISQQMSGMMLFEPGLSTGPQQGFVFQPTRGHVAGDHNYGRGQRGGGRGGRGGRPY